jgi:hypothetical protein
MANENTKTSKELLNELVESYKTENKTVTGINGNFIDGINKFLDSVDNGSIFHYTVDEIGFCGMDGHNHVMVVLNGAKGQPFTKSEKFSITMDENCKATICSNYCHSDFDFGSGRMQYEIITNLIKYNMEVSEMKEKMSGKFEKVANFIKDILDGTELQVKWCEIDNSRLMISDKEGNDFFSIKGKCFNRWGEVEFDSKPCKAFDWAPTVKLYEKNGGFPVLDLFMATNDFCKKVSDDKYKMI